MTLTDLQTMLTQLQQLDLDNQAGVSPSSSDTTAQLNWALRWIADQTWCCYDDKVPITLVSGTRRYSIQATTPKLITVHRVIVDSNPLRKPDGEIGLYTYSDVQTWHPHYLSYADGTPQGAFMQDDYRLVLFPAPDATIAAESDHYLAGPYLPAALSQGSDTPDIPVQYHEHIAYVAAAFTSKPLASEGEAWTRIQSYNAHIAMDLKKLQARMKARFMPSNGMRGRRADWSGGDVIAPSVGGYRTR